MFAKVISHSSSGMGLLGSKTRSVGQMIEKPCKHSKSHIFSDILYVLGQNGCLGKISLKFEYGSAADHKLGQ